MHYTEGTRCLKRLLYLPESMMRLPGHGHCGWAAILGLVILQSADALVPLSDWVDGLATYYGGKADGMDPYSPSYGTADVSA